MKKILVVIVVILVTISGCNQEYNNTLDSHDIEYQINFFSNGGNEIDSLVVNKGDYVTLPSTPVKEGYDFVGWYTDEGLTVAFNSDLQINESMSLYAKWDVIKGTVYLKYEDLFLGGFYLNYGEELELPEVTIKEFEFIGWYLEPALENEVSTIKGKQGTTTYYAKLEEKDIVIEDEDEIIKTELPYYEYMSDTNPVVIITVKDIGVMTLELFPDVAKNTVDNFINYILDDSYSSSSFHRVIEGFMIQGGIVDITNCPILGEFASNNGITNDLKHNRGVISMARTNDKNSATSQFFIVHDDAFHLDGNYAGFGGLISGFNVLDYIATVTRDVNNNDVPIRDVIIESITVDLNGYIVGEVVCNN